MIKQLRRSVYGSIVLLILLLGAHLAHAGTFTGTINQPSGQPVQNGTVNLTISQPAYSPGSFAQTASTISCYTGTNGGIVGIKNPYSVTPTVTPQTGTGTLGSGNYYVVFSYWNASGETFYSAEAAVNLSSTGRLQISSPVSQSTATGWNYYASNASGTETQQGHITGFGVSQFISAPLSAGAALPSSNTTTCVFNFNDALIPARTVYRTNLLDSNGGQVAGFPQIYYFQGSTVDISNLTPASNLTALFPQALVMNPSAQALQSVNGPVNILGYLKLGADAQFTNAPRMTWSGYVSTTSNATLASVGFFIPDKGIVITRITAKEYLAAPAGCSTAPNFLVFDSTTSQSSAAAVIANVATFGDSGAISFSVAAGDTLNLDYTATGCSTQAQGVNVTVEYRMQ